MMKKIVSLVVCLALLLAVAGVSLGEEAALKAGTYTATEYGMGGQFDVVVTFSDSAILSVEAPDSNETIMLGTEAIRILSERIVENQSLNLDAVTGATITSNAVLRGVDRRREEPLTFRDDLDALSVRTSHPRALVERMVSLLGAEEAEEFLLANNAPAPITIHTNTLRSDDAALQSSLEEEGVRVTPHPWLPGCFTVSGTGSLESLRAWREGKFIVQDAAARLAALAADPKPGNFVIDVCAAPGGKSFAMASLMNCKGKILSCDMEEHKLQLMKLGAERLGIDCMEIRLMDGRSFREELADAADVVLCDVPCSGLGIIRKKPDIRYKELSTLTGLKEIQYAILENASRYVKPGGTLVYSTCTLLREENAGQVENFLKKHPDFEPDPEGFEAALPAFLKERAHGWMLQLQAHRDGMDGFFIARMRRRAE